MTSADEKHRNFNQTMARLHVREQKLAADLDKLDKEMQQFRRDLVAFHARRAFVHALMQQEALDAETKMVDANVAMHEDVKGSAAGFSDQDAAPTSAPIHQDVQRVAHEFSDQGAQSVAAVTAPDQNANPVVDDGESLFIPEQARSQEHVNFLNPRPKRRVTFADDADSIGNENASSESNAQINDNVSVTAPKSPPH